MSWAPCQGMPTEQSALEEIALLAARYVVSSRYENDDPTQRALRDACARLESLREGNAPADGRSTERTMTIEQVIAACESIGMVDARITIRRPSIGNVSGFVVEAIHAGKPGYLSQTHFTTEKPDEAIQQLGRDAIAKIKERHAADAAKLKELGVTDV